MSINAIVSFDGTENDLDALALARAFASTGAHLSLAYVRHAHELESQEERRAQREADQILDRGAAWLGEPEIERHVVVNASTGEGLWAHAESQGADVVIFGSDWHTAPGHVQPGRSAARLMEGGPVAIAIATAGLHRHDVKLERVALAGGEVDAAARRTAEAFADAAGTPLALPSQDAVDLLVVGSQPGAPSGRVRLSAASEYVVETARASVLIVARDRALGARLLEHSDVPDAPAPAPVIGGTPTSVA